MAIHHRSGSALVRLSDAANEYVIADAIRIEKLSAGAAAELEISASTVFSTMQTTVEPLAAEPLPAIQSPAVGWWLQAGLPAEAAQRLVSAPVEIADLPDRAPGRAAGDVIWIDQGAAGMRWFVAQKSWGWEEFTRMAAETLLVGRTAESVRKVNLLTVWARELDHVFGLQHEAEDHRDHCLMDQWIRPAQRRLPASSELDLLFADHDLLTDGTPISACPTTRPPRSCSGFSIR